MAMFPIFMLGIVAGILISYVFFHYVKTIPTNTKFKLQEDTIKNRQDDMRSMELVNDDLRRQIDELKAKKKSGRKPKVVEE